MSANRIWQSTVGKKVVMAITGIGLMLFLVVHLAGNLLLFVPDGGVAFNKYGAALKDMGALLYVIRGGLLAFFLFHIVAAIQVYTSKKRARAGRYALETSKGGPSKLSVSSKSMIVTGVVLLIFVPLHIWMFGMNKGAPPPMVMIDGSEVKDIYTMVATSFNQLGIVVFYVGTMLFLGFHLRHGFWSALQSLGAMNPKWTPAIYAAGFVFALLLAGGFLLLPLYFFFFVDVPVAGTGGDM